MCACLDAGAFTLKGFFMGHENKKKLDIQSIKTTTMLYFMFFAFIIITVIWCLQDFFINNYYESMRYSESLRTATALESQYKERSSSFDKYASETALSNGIYIRVEDSTNVTVYGGTASFSYSMAEFSSDVRRIKSKLSNTPLDSVSLVLNNADNNKRLIYASSIPGMGGEATIIIISPLYPNTATVSIVRNMLVYISLIVTVLAVSLSLYLSRKISAPIEGLTVSASELGRGNYHVRFNGGNFTETKELAKTLSKASYEMEKTEFYQREIVANVSHDLKTPLTMIRSYAEMIHDISGDNPAKRNEHLGVIISETDRLNKLVTEMMTVSKLQSNQIELNKETVNIVELAKSSFNSFKVLSDQDGFELKFKPCKDCYVYGDKDKLLQVMNNFISNAVKYSGDNKFVSVELKRSAKKVTVHVIDHGVGIPKEELSHVWDRYYRTSANHQRNIEGTGIGLSIVKGILTLHNADYGVESTEGQGSDFWFSMDVVRKPSK